MNDPPNFQGESGGADDPPVEPQDAVATGPDPEDDTVERHSIRRNIAQMTGSQAVTWVLATITAVIVPQFLGTDLYGRLQLALSLWAIAAVFTALGTSLHLQLSIARNQREGLALIGDVFRARTLAFVLAAAGAAAYVLAFENDREFATIMAIVGVASLFVLWSEVFQSVFTGLERMSVLAFVDAAGKALLLLLTIAVLTIGWGVYGVVGVAAGVAALGLAVFARQYRRVRPAVSIPRNGRLVELLKASAPYMGVTLALTVYRQIDVIVISRVATDRDVGWYGAADLLAGSLLFPTTVIMATVLPTFGRLHVEDPDRLRDLVRRTFSLLLLVAVPIGLGAAVVGPEFAPLLYGDDFDGTGTALVIFGPITILSFATTLLANVALAVGRARFLALMLTGLAVVTVGLDIFLVPWSADRYDNGAVGGAIAYVITETGQFVFALAFVTPYLVTRRWAWRSLRVLAAGGVMVAATMPFRNELFLLPALVGAFVYPAALLLFRCVDAEQRSMVANLLGRGRNDEST